MDLSPWPSNNKASRGGVLSTATSGTHQAPVRLVQASWSTWPGQQAFSAPWSRAAGPGCFLFIEGGDPDAPGRGCLRASTQQTQPLAEVLFNNN